MYPLNVLRLESDVYSADIDEKFVSADGSCMVICGGLLIQTAVFGLRGY